MKRKSTTRRKPKAAIRVRARYRNRVRECRLKALVRTQVELARATDIERATISAIENNNLFLSAPYALLISEALGCPLDHLYERIESDGGVASGRLKRGPEGD